MIKMKKATVILILIFFSLCFIKSSAASYSKCIIKDIGSITFECKNATVKLSSSKESRRQHMKSTVLTYKVIEKEKVIGEVILTLNRFNDDDLHYFIRYSSQKLNESLKVTLKCNDLGTDYKYIVADPVNQKYLSDKNIAQEVRFKNEITYIQSPQCNIRFGKIHKMKDIGYSVHQYSVPDNTGVVARVENNKTEFSMELIPEASSKSFTITEGMISKNRLVQWNDAQALNTAKLIDFNQARIFMSDGLYRENYTTYTPRALPALSVFKDPCGFLVRSCYWVFDNGSLFKILGINLMYNFADSVGPKGYIPTQPSSDWLKTDYNIGFGFYDTRWNSDTMTSLMTFNTNLKDKEVDAAVKRYINFYKQHYKKNSFIVDGVSYVADYSDSNLESKNVHCSLNHLLAEMQVLYQYYQIYKDEECKQIADKMLVTVTQSSKKWIKNDGDLWYKVTVKGIFNGNDYPALTYNDLVYSVNQLKQLNIPVPNELLMLIESKGKWALEKKHITSIFKYKE